MLKLWVKYTHTQRALPGGPRRVQIEHVNTLMVAKTLRYLTPVQILHNGQRKGAERVSQRQIKCCAISFFFGLSILRLSAPLISYFIQAYCLFSLDFVVFCQWGLSVFVTQQTPPVKSLGTPSNAILFFFFTTFYTD